MSIIYGSLTNIINSAASLFAGYLIKLANFHNSPSHSLTSMKSNDWDILMYSEIVLVFNKYIS